LFYALKEITVVVETLRELNFGETRDCSAYLTVLVKEDNQSCIKAILNPLGTPDTKDLASEIKFIKDSNVRGIVLINEDSWVETGANVADIFTKPLGRTLFRRHARNLITNSVMENTTTWLTTTGSRVGE
jgi:hypothetical protein